MNESCVRDAGQLGGVLLLECVCISEFGKNYHWERLPTGQNTSSKQISCQHIRPEICASDVLQYSYTSDTSRCIQLQQSIGTEYFTPSKNGPPPKRYQKITAVAAAGEAHPLIESLSWRMRTGTVSVQGLPLVQTAPLQRTQTTPQPGGRKKQRRRTHSAP